MTALTVKNMSTKRKCLVNQMYQFRLSYVYQFLSSKFKWVITREREIAARPAISLRNNLNKEKNILIRKTNADRFRRFDDILSSLSRK